MKKVVPKELFDKKTLDRLKQFIALRLKETSDAEEIFQETLISAYQSLPCFRGQSSLFTWLCGIAKHEISDFYRKKKIKAILFSHLPFLENLANQALGPEEEMMEAELKWRVKHVLAGLNEGYQIILRLKYIEGHPVAQIAKKLNLTLKAVESRLSRARLAFREAWISENFEFPVSNDRQNRKHQKDSFF